MNFTDRFFKKVVKTETCWHWTAGKIKEGYGRVKVNKKLYLAHRLSYIIHIGPIPDDLLVCHKCDVRDCVNPKHLFLGTKRDNAIDMVNKNRHGGMKLSTQQIEQIRFLFSSGFDRKHLASKFNVSYSHIVSIINHSRRKS